MRTIYIIFINIVNLVKLVIFTLLFFILSFLKFFRDLCRHQYCKIDNNRKKDDVLIMGNGPSLNTINFDSISRDKIKICCVNNFPSRSELFFLLKPEYLCIIDPGYYDFIIESEREEIENLFKTIEKVDWPVKIIAPKGKKLKVTNPYVTYEWVNTNVIKRSILNIEKWFLLNINLANTGMQNVVLGALYYFICANFNRIFIVGADFSDFKNLYVDEDNRIYVDSTHSYGVTRNYFDVLPGDAFSSFYKVLGAYQNMFFEASKVREYADYKGIDIINLSLQSYIDSFEKKSPDILYHSSKDK